jgi:hypothetical protein
VPVDAPEARRAPRPQGTGAASVSGITPGNLLIVYDQSASMRDDRDGQPRWLAASDAMMAAIEPVKDLLTSGPCSSPASTRSLSSALAISTR